MTKTYRLNPITRVVNAIFSALGLPPQIEFIEMPAHLREKYQYYTCADISKLQRETGWSPALSLDQTLADTLAYWRQKENQTS